MPLLIILSVILFNFISSNSHAGLNKELEQSQIRMDIRTEVSYSKLTDEAGVNYSHVQLQWLNNQKMNLREAQQKFKENGAQGFRVHKLILNLSGKFSMAPYLVRGPSEDKALNTLQDKIAPYREQIAQSEASVNSQIEKAVDGAILANPSLAPFKQSIIDSTKLAQQSVYDKIAAAKLQIDQKEAMAKTDISSRLDKLVTETSIQEVAIEIGYIFEGQYLGGQISLFAKIGKFKVHSGFETGDTDQTNLEEVTPQNVLAQRGMGTSGTTSINLTKIFRAQSYTVQGDVYVFHNRIPWLSAEQYVTSILNMSQEDWEKHDNLSDLDSTMMRLLVESKSVNVYFAAGSYDGESSHGEGILFKITQKDDLYFDYYSGNRENVAKKGSAVYYVHRFDRLPILGSKVSSFIGTEKYKEAYAPEKYGTDPINYSQTGFGASKQVKTNFGKQTVFWTFKAGIYRNRAHETESGKDLGSKNYGIFTVNGKW